MPYTPYRSGKGIKKKNEWFRTTKENSKTTVKLVHPTIEFTSKKLKRRKSLNLIILKS